MRSRMVKGARWLCGAFLMIASLLSGAPAAHAQAAAKRPNVVVVFGDDIGQSNVSAYSFGVMG